MEFTPVQVAKLVLGYLKKENCRETVLAFCDESQHLKYYSDTIKKKKYFITRVGGYSLVDYLSQYALIYTLINERLEDSDYFEDKHSKNLVDQLIYLIDRNGKQNSKSTSCSRSSTPLKELNKEQCHPYFPKNISIIEESAGHCEATSLRSLPGNNSDKGNKTNSLSPRSRKSNENVESEAEDIPDKSLEEDDLSVQVLTQTLLEHRELHEKLAENINLVRSTSEAVTVAKTDEQISSGMLQELDSAIKAIVQKTEADPIFEKLIGEIIGNVGENTTDEEQTDGCKDNNNDINELKKSGRILKSCSQKDAENLINNEQRNVIQNSAKIEILPSSQLVTKENLTANEVNNVQQSLTVNTVTDEVILYDGTLESFLKPTSTCVISNSSNNSVLFSNSLLMVQPTLPAIMPTVSTVQVNPSKPSYMWNGSQLLNVSVPQIKLNNLTEQDILNMPTVIVCDDNQQGILHNPAMPSNINQQSALPQKKFVNIAPRQEKTADNAETISEFIKLYQCNDSNDGCASSKLQDLKKSRVKLKKKSKKIIKKPLQQTEVRTASTNDVKVEVTENENKKDAIEEAETEKQVNSKTTASTTPEFKKQSNRRRSLSTPKSGSLSHVRALDFDFETPGKRGIKVRKANTSPKSLRKSPKISPTSSATKISKSLFSTPVKSEKVDEAEGDKSANKTEKKVITPVKKKVRRSWDSDLRALTGPVSDRCPTPKRKRKEIGRSRKIVKKIKTDVGTETLLSESNADAQNNSNQKQTNGLKDKEIIPTEKTEDIVKVEDSNIKQLTPIPPTEIPTADVNIDDKECEINDEIPSSYLPDIQFSLINCNAKARYKRKCNIDNNLKKEVKITKVKEIKSLEFVNDGSTKLILSPSKLNANKRTLVETDEKDRLEDEAKSIIGGDMVILEQTILKLDSQEINNKIEVQEQVDQKPVKSDEVKPTSTFITPEMQNAPLIQHPVISKRNITPMLETPMKMNLSLCPKTPGVLSPVSNFDTPFTKVFKEQLQGVDISSIRTPKFPLTPNFPFTPTTDGKSPYPIRSSDYSTSSSYYQPSDAEQNKSLEQLMIDECKRLENRKDSPVKVNVKEDMLIKTDLSEIQKSEDIPKELKDEVEQDLTNKAIAEKMRSLSSNIIARKNLSLVEKIAEKVDDSLCASSSTGDDSSSSSSSDNISDDDMWNSTNNKTVVQQKCASRYNLRSRKDEPVESKEDDVGKTEIIQQILAETEIKTTLQSTTKVSTLSNIQEKVLQEMEEKRQRIIAKLKDDQNVKVKTDDYKTPPKEKRNTNKKDQPSSTKERRVAKNTLNNKCKNSINRRKSNLPKKLVQKTKDVTKKVEASTPIVNDNKQFIADVTKKVETSTPIVNDNKQFIAEPEGATLHLSSDSEVMKLEPFDVVETELRESSTCSTPVVTNKIPESHPLKSFHKVLESIRNNQSSEKSKECTSDQEAETLVKGLKEWGIHLIPNKSPKKQSTLQENVVDKANPIPEKIDIKCNDNLLTSSLDLKADDKNITVPNTSVKETTQVLNKTIHAGNIKINQSLEEGEIISEAEETIPNTGNKKRKNNDKYTTKASRKYYTEPRPAKKYKRINSPRSTSGRSKSSKVRKTEIKVEKHNTKTSSKEESCKEKIANKISENLNLSSSMTGDIIFDVKTISQEDIHVMYDENKKCGRNITDYSSDLLNKKVSVKVYIDSIDQEVEKFMTVTPLDFILDISKGIEPKIKILNCVTIPGKKEIKPLTLLHNHLNVEGKIDMSTVSPLDNLYEPTVNSGYGLVQRRNSEDHLAENLQNKSSVRHTRSKSVDQKSYCANKLRSELFSTPSIKQEHMGVVAKKTPSKSKPKMIEKTTSRDNSNKLSSVLHSTLPIKETAKKTLSKSKPKIIDKDKKMTSKDISQSKQRKATTNSKDNKKQTTGMNKSASSVSVSPLEKKINLEKMSSKIKKINSEDVTDISATNTENTNDDLMNYAICGSQRIENVDVPDTKERSSDGNDKIKDLNTDSCQELLSKIDVDVFLKKLHGE